METIAIPKDKYNELKRKADAYDKMNAGASTGGKRSRASLTPRATLRALAPLAWLRLYFASSARSSAFSFLSLSSSLFIFLFQFPPAEGVRVSTLTF